MNAHIKAELLSILEHNRSIEIEVLVAYVLAKQNVVSISEFEKRVLEHIVYVTNYTQAIAEIE